MPLFVLYVTLCLVLNVILALDTRNEGGMKNVYGRDRNKDILRKEKCPFKNENNIYCGIILNARMLYNSNEGSPFGK